MKLRCFEDGTAVHKELVSRIVLLLREAIQLRGQAYLVVSGGTSPIALFQLLAKEPLPWEQVTILLADERCVPLEHEDRNERIVKKHLIQYEAQGARFQSLYDASISPEESLKRALEACTLLPYFDVLILGMGTDGHTASLFPGSDELSLAQEEHAPPVLYIHPKTAPHARVSLSQQRLMKSHHLFLPIYGIDKWAVLQQAIAEPNLTKLPISAFLLNQALMLDIFYAPNKDTSCIQ